MRDDEYGYRIDPSGLNNCDRKSGPGPEAWEDSDVAGALKDLRDTVDLTQPCQMEVTAVNGYALDPEAQKQQMDAFIEMVRRKRQNAGLKPVQPKPTPSPDDYSARAADAKRRLFENETGAYWLDLMMAAPLPKKGNDE